MSGTTALQTSARGFLARYEGLRERLPGDAGLRAQAAEVFRTSGLPTIRREEWKYTNLRPLAETSFYEPLTSLAEGQSLLGRLPLVEAPRLVLLDGRFRDDLSWLPAGLQIESFAEQPDFGSLARPEQEPLVALNTMLAEDGVTLSVPAGQDAGLVQLISLGTETPGRAVAFHPRHIVRLGDGARLVLLEMSVGEGTYLHNPVMELHIGQGAVLTHVRLQQEAPEAFHLATLYATIAERGVYDSFGLHLGGRLARSEVHAHLAGLHGATHLNAAQLLGGSQHADFTTEVFHDAACCASRQTVKNVLMGRSRGVFQGKIQVARGAQKTDGYQMNQALLLSPEAEIDSKPQLEIYADDVKCSHGATVGELDATQLFYLRSRGVPEAEARGILVRAFLMEALDTVSDDRARSVLDQAVEGWWERQVA
ncbi:MAG: Fe-S cluster assembly protein SufD [Acetobacteraceae bacterium]|nr:Fe-S cluster assembly protein SufD [Acetobacteraceae bacterium]MBV8523104.1 Fe-S cluster assembly protein SufD [Acetobacteraceae bacterium]